jgi:LPXTG-motif cell wall-anchored protein
VRRIALLAAILAVLLILPWLRRLPLTGAEIAPYLVLGFGIVVTGTLLYRRRP